MNESVRDAPRSAREILIEKIEEECSYRWQNAHRDPQNATARHAYDAVVELRSYVRSMPPDDRDAQMIDALASVVFDGPELLGLLALHGNRLHGEPAVFVATLIELSSAKAIDAVIAGITE